MMKPIAVASIGLVIAGALMACETTGVSITDDQKAALSADAKKLAEDAKPVVEEAISGIAEKIKE